MIDSMGEFMQFRPGKPLGPGQDRFLRAAWARLWKQGRGGEWRYLRKDRLPVPTVLLVMAILTMTIGDGVLTLLLLDHQFEEANPLMRFFLGIHPMAFVIGKYALTAACLPFLLIFGHRPIFLPRLRVAHLLPAIMLLYVLLLTYQVAALYQF
jgi:hypothetical protein